MFGLTFSSPRFGCIVLYRKVKKMVENMENVLKQVNEYISCNMLAGIKGGSDEFEQLEMAAMLALKPQLDALPPITAPEATKLIKVLGEGPFSAPARSELLNTISGQVAHARAKSSRPLTQSNLHFQWYLTNTDWAKLENPNMSYGQKLCVLISRMMSLGLKHPTEHTMTQIMSILHLAGKDENEVSSVKPMVFYKSLSDFKALLKSTRKQRLNARTYQL